MRPRVLIIDHSAALGGVELRLLDLAAAWRDHVSVLLFEDGPLRARLEARGVPVYLRPGRAIHEIRRATPRPGWRAASEVMRLALRTVPIARRHDCLHAHTQKAFLVAAIAGMIARRPVVWDLHDLMVPEHFSPLNRRIGGFLARHAADRIIANSAASARAVIGEGAPADRVRVIYNGIDEAPFEAVTPGEIASARAQLGIPSAPVVGVFGRLAPWKGQHVAIEALQSLPGVHLLIVGDALFGEDDYAAGLRDLAASRGLADRVHFAGFRADIPRLMRLVDIVAHTSTAPEPFGRVIVEGMLAERPVVATMGGGVSEIIRDGVSGVLVPPGDAPALARAIRGVLAFPAHAALRVAAGRREARERFGLSTMLASMQDQLEVVCP